MANVTNVQVKIENENTAQVKEWTIQTQYTNNNLDVTSNEYDVISGAKQYLTTISKGLGDKHDTTMIATVDLGTGNHQKTTVTFKAKDNMVVTFTYKASGNLTYATSN